MVGVWDGNKLGWIPNDNHASQFHPNIPMIRRCSTILPIDDDVDDQDDLGPSGAERSGHNSV